MTLKDEAREPWGYYVAGLSGALAAVFTAAPVAVGVGVGVLAAKLLAGAFIRPAGPRKLRVEEHSDESAWVARAERAERSFHDIARGVPAGPVAERVTSFGGEVDEALASVHRLAGQASAIRRALERLDPRTLTADRDRLRSARQAERDPRIAAERDRAVAAVQSQLDSYQRMSGALATLLARLEAGVLGLEDLVSRLAEVVALAETSGTTEGLDQVDQLATELEGLRAGLVEAEGVTTRAMEGLPPVPAPGSVAPEHRPAEE